MLRGVRKVDLVIADCRENGAAAAYRGGGEVGRREERGSSGRELDLRPHPLTERITYRIGNCAEMRSGGQGKGVALKEGQRGSLHQTKASTKPTVPVSCRNKENNPLAEVRTIGIKAKPFPGSGLKGSSRASPNCATDSSKQTIGNSTVRMEREESRNNESQLELQRLMGQSYQLKIVELQEENQKFVKTIAQLQGRLRRQEEEKGLMEIRIDTVERELSCLQSEYSEIQMQNQPMANYQGVETNQIATQTDPVKAGDEQSVQTEAQNLAKVTVCPLPCLDGEDWFSRARVYQMSLQQQKLLHSNRQKEWRLQWQNGQIEWRLRVQTLQRQLGQLRAKYEGKCQQVREKEGLINRLIHRP